MCLDYIWLGGALGTHSIARHFRQVSESLIWTRMALAAMAYSGVSFGAGDY